MKPRRWAYAAVALVVAAALADAGAWYAGQRLLARWFAAWAAAQAAQGLVVTAGPATPGGYPFAVTRSFALSLQAGAAAMRSDRVVLGLSPARAGTLRVDLPAPVALSAPALPPLTLASADWHADMRLDGSGDAATDATGLSVTVAGTAGPPRQVQVALLHVQAQPEAGGLDVAGSAQSIALPEPLPGEVWPLGRHLASVAFGAMLQGRLPSPSPGAAWLSRAALAAWRDSGGAVALRRLAVGYGPLGVSGQATVSLDQRLQPQGQAALRILGYAETLDALVSAHVMSAHAAQAAGAVLGLLAQAPPGGGAPVVTLAVRLQDGTLTAAGFPLLRLPELAWPAS